MVSTQKYIFKLYYWHFLKFSIGMQARLNHNFPESYHNIGEN